MNNQASLFQNKVLIALVLVLLLGVGGWYWISSRNAQSSFSNNSSGDQRASSTSNLLEQKASKTESAGGGQMNEAAVKEFTVTGSNYKFEPATISVAKGDRVKIIYKVSDGFHDFTLDDFKVGTKQLSAGGSETIEFTADKIGTFEFYCSVGNHRQMGMRGNLVVK